MAIEISVQYNVGLLPDIILLTQRLLPSGNPFKYHVEVLSLQPMKQYIITTMFDYVIMDSFCFVFAFCLVSLHGDQCSKCTV